MRREGEMEWERRGKGREKDDLYVTQILEWRF